MKKFINLVKAFLYTQRYLIGFVENHNNQANLFSQIKWLDLGGYKNGWFADPFILSANESEIIVLAEEYVYSTKLGRLVRLAIDRKGFRLKKIDVILDLPTHLSFPIFFKENGKTYLYPENYQSGALTMYEYNDSTKLLGEPITIITEPLLDSQIVKIEDAYYLFAVKYTSGLQEDTKVLLIYKSSTLTGPYSKIQVIENERNEERGAGAIYINNKGKIIRPVQSCEGGYGKELILKELIPHNDVFTQVEIARHCTNGNLSTGCGMHTYNSFGDLIVVDVYGFRYLISRWIKKLKKLAK